jgi:hypothetical protein
VILGQERDDREGRRRGGWQYICEDEAVALDDGAYIDANRPFEHGPGGCESVKLAILAARVDPVREGIEQVRVESASRKGAVDPAGVEARDGGFEAARNHLSCERCGVPHPEGENGRHSDLTELGFAISTQIFEKEVSEDDPVDPQPANLREHTRHLSFVDLVWTR